MKRTILQNTLVTLGSFIFVITVLNAWTGPSTTPPDPNVSAPLNVSSTGQQKTGGLIVGSLISGGSVQIGNTTTVCAPTIAGAIRWNTGVMEYCNGTVWGPFVGTSSGGSGGNSSPYCAYSGQSKSTNPSTSGVNSTCGMSVDSTGYQTLSASIAVYEDSGESRSWYSCSDSKYNADSAGCQYNGIAFTGPISASFNRDTGVLRCTVIYGGNNVVSTVTFTKDQSKCAGSGSTAETDPTVLASVKDGVSWAEVTGKPTQIAGSVIGGCTTQSDCWGAATSYGICSVGSTRRNTGGPYDACGGSDSPCTANPYLCIKN
jgi:hypothetical protein